MNLHDRYNVINMDTIIFFIIIRFTQVNVAARERGVSLSVEKSFLFVETLHNYNLS